MSASRSFATCLAKIPVTACRRTLPMRLSQNIPSQSSRGQSVASSRAIRFSPVPQRAFTTTTQRRHGHIDPPKPGEELYVTFIEKDGVEHKFAVSEGDNLLDIAQANDLEMEGACG
ncbi:hypothetical protein F66182_8330, partial [Fusarium sp. NRRL 66182]